MPIYLGFDMGIRNLAYCMVEHTDDTWNILHWDNIDLLENGQSSQISNQCVACSSKAQYIHDDKRWCKGCATNTKKKRTLLLKPSVPILPCQQDAKSLRNLAVSIEIEGAKKLKKDELLAKLSHLYLMPWKPQKSTDASLTDIRRAMDKWLQTMLHTFSKSSVIRLENQPVMKGPTMKSVQIILFTLLGHRLEKDYDWKGSLEFVHAGTKTKNAPVIPVSDSLTSAQADGAAYRARKKTAETDVLDILTKLSSSSPWLAFFQSRKKKSDLADAFLMAMRK